MSKKENDTNVSKKLEQSSDKIVIQGLLQGTVTAQIYHGTKSSTICLNDMINDGNRNVIAVKQILKSLNYDTSNIFYNGTRV